MRLGLAALALLVVSASPSPAKTSADELADLRKQKLEVARKWQHAVYSRYETESTGGDVRETYAVSRALMESERDVATTKAERVAIVHAHLDRTLAQYRKIYALFVEAARGGEAEKLYRCECWLLEARQLLREEKAKDTP
jgi:hypothetical protein